MSMTYSRATLGLSIAVGGALILLARAIWGKRSRLPYPPGPKGYPIIQNLFDLPLKTPWEGYAALSKKYGMHYG